MELNGEDLEYYKSISLSLVIVLKNEETFLKKYKEQYRQVLKELPNLTIHCIDDGSTDQTLALLKECEQDRFSVDSNGLSLGKNLRIREFIDENPLFFKGALYAFADGNTQFTKESIIQIMNAFQDNRVGCCSSVLEYNDGFRYEGTYWQNENRIKKQESKVSTQVGATGALFAVREGVYQAQNDSFPIDLALSLNALLKGFASISTYKSRVFEDINSKDVSTRKHRTLLRGMSCAFFYLPLLMRSKKYLTVFCLVSHKVIRWFSPIFVILILSGLNWFSFVLMMMVTLAFMPYSPIYLLKMFWSSVKAFLFFIVGKKIRKW